MRAEQAIKKVWSTPYTYANEWDNMYLKLAHEVF